MYVSRLARSLPRRSLKVNRKSNVGCSCLSIDLLDLVDQLESRVLSSQPDGELHDPETCLCCQLELVRLYELEEELEKRTRRILVDFHRTHRPAQGRELPRR